MTRPTAWALVHDLDRTGVPVALARLARWPGTRAAVDLRVVARFGGRLEAELRAAGAEVVVLEPTATRSPASTLAAATAQAGWPGPGAAVRDAWWRRQVRHLPTPEVVLIQGAGALTLATALRPATGRARWVLHLHELDAALDRSAGPAERALLPDLHHVMVVAEPLRKLVADLGVRAERTSVVPGAVDDPPAGWAAPIPPPAGSLEVLSIGEAGWRKGTDRAVAAAHELRRRVPGARWHWVGAGLPPGWAYPVDTATPLVWHAPTTDPWAAVVRPAVLVVPSREDPLPLVALEAGARAVPVVATATGGLADLLADGRGTVVPQAALEELVDAVAAVLGDPIAAGEAGERLRSHVRRHHRLDAVGPAWLSALTGA